MKRLKTYKQLLESALTDKDKDNISSYIISTNIINGEYDKVKTFLENGGDVNAHDFSSEYYDDSLLMVAIRSAKIDIVKLLIEYDVDLNFQDLEMNTALHWATYNNLYDIIKLLVDAGADVNLVEDYDDTPFMTAFFNINKKDKTIKLKIIDLLITKTNLNLVNSNGNDVFHYIQEFQYNSESDPDKMPEYILYIQDNYPKEYEKYLRRNKAKGFNL